MSDIKKDHSIGSGTGAIGGAIAGGTVGSMAGPVGTVVGAIAGGVVGAKTGDAIAEAVNPTEYLSQFENKYRQMPYYTDGREWADYKPAYQYGYDTYDKYRGQKFEAIESDLERKWDSTRTASQSQLAWNEARGAVKDGWHYIERALPGDLDRDGR